MVPAPCARPMRARIGPSPQARRTMNGTESFSKTPAPNGHCLRPWPASPPPPAHLARSSISAADSALVSSRIAPGSIGSARSNGRLSKLRKWSAPPAPWSMTRLSGSSSPFRKPPIPLDHPMWSLLPASSPISRTPIGPWRNSPHCEPRGRSSNVSPSSAPLHGTASPARSCPRSSTAWSHPSGSSHATS